MERGKVYYFQCDFYGRKENNPANGHYYLIIDTSYGVKQKDCILAIPFTSSNQDQVDHIWNFKATVGQTRRRYVQKSNNSFLDRPTWALYDRISSIDKKYEIDDGEIYAEFRPEPFNNIMTKISKYLKGKT